MSVWEIDNLGTLSEKVSWAVAGVATFTFILRVICRLRYTVRQGGGLYQDDFITLASLLVLLLFCVLLSVAVPFGVGQHYQTLSDRNKVEALRWNAILIAVTPWICTLPKFAIITTVQRILNFENITTRLFWGLAITSQLTVVGLMIWGLVQCSPVAYQWDRSLEGGTCADPLIYVRFAYAVYIYSTVLEVFFALYPVPFIMRLRMPLSARLGVAIPLSFSWVGFAISVFKFTELPQMGSLLVTDPSYPLVFLCMTHAAEGAFLIMATSLATLRPLFRGIKQHAVDLSASTKTRSRVRVSFLGGNHAALRLRSEDEANENQHHTFEDILLDGRGKEPVGGGEVVWELHGVQTIDRRDSALGKKALDGYPI